MSPQETGAAAALARLLGELEQDHSAMLRRSDELGELLGRWPQAQTDRAQVIVAAVALHGWYTAMETLLERIARTVDREVPSGSRSHAELLSQMMVAIPHVRPAVLSRTDEPALLALLAFRHFFRHAYAVELDPLRVEQEIRRLLQVAASVNQHLAQFQDFVSSALKRLGEDDQLQD